MSETIRWQLDMPVQRAKELEALEKTYGFSSRKDLVNTALSMLQWAIDEVKGGRVLASVDEKTMRYKELVLPAFKVAAAQAVTAQAPLSASIAELEAAEVRLAQSPGKNAEAIQKVQEARAAVAEAVSLAA